jgi:hypothetical protein
VFTDRAAYACGVLCTIVWDTYAWDERRSVWEALKALVVPDEAIWSRKGLYVYWDPATHEMLYTGLATHLADRFGHHNGLIKHSGGNKFADVKAWFDGHTHMGFSVMLQAAGVEMQDAISDVSNLLAGAKSADVIRGAEGQLIELHRLERGRWPTWNRTGGAVAGQRWATESARSVVRVLTAEQDSLFVSRTALRELAADAMAQEYEDALHGARLHALMAADGVTVTDLESFEAADSDEKVQRIIKAFMLAAGHLIDDLSPSDADIIERLRQIEDGRILSEGRKMRREIEEWSDTPIAGDREAAKMIYATSLWADAVEQPRHAAIIKRLFSSDYLARSPQLTGLLSA